MVDLDVDPSRPCRVLAVAIFFFCLTWIAVSLRLYSKLCLTRVFALDDKLLCVAQALFTTYLVAQILSIVHGFGLGVTEASLNDKVKALEYFFIGEILYIVTTVLLKVCVGVLLLRVAIVGAHIWILRLLVSAALLFGGATTLLVIFQCRPAHVFWVQGPRTPGHCLESSILLGVFYAAAILNCLTDWAFVVLSFFVTWSLGLQMKTNIQILVLLGFASIACIAAIIQSITVPSLVSKANFLRDTTHLAIWSTVEPGVGIIVVCAPALHTIARHLSGRKRRQGHVRGVYRVRSPSAFTTMSTANTFLQNGEGTGQSSLRDAPRLRFDDFTYESHISGPGSRKRPPLPKRSSWAFPLRPRSAMAGMQSSTDSTPSKASISTGAASLEPPPSGIMKTMEFELSYEARTWTMPGRLVPRDEGMGLRRSTVVEMTRIASREMQHLGFLSAPTPEFDICSEYTLPSFRHSSPLPTTWDWADINIEDPLSVHDVKPCAQEVTQEVHREDTSDEQQTISSGSIRSETPHSESTHSEYTGDIEFPEL
ncbi:hypothetical protein CCHL11_04978 [Colletotrichum chlorophyti]|uniref:Rhodopsin domain-containing protein n=1 Tax=Colletotrichum chlorophyti TaxID=708187 RepID=A0A1Q8S2H6_9PEZI|nr:hypothetical protein CCHL11_04978 [Colletotrichum chlorophyti]